MILGRQQEFLAPIAQVNAMRNGAWCNETSTTEGMIA